MEYKELKNQAEKELEEKLALESPFKKELAALFLLISNEFVTKYKVYGTPPNAQQYRIQFETLFRKHYARVQKRFKGKVLSANNILASEEIQDEIDLLLVEWADQTAPKQAQIVTATTQDNFNNETVRATQMFIEENKPVTKRGVALAAGALLRKVFSARKENIAVYETQNTAEAAKKIEAEKIPEIMRKQWITVGDKVVRITHKEANRQKRDLDDAFNVGISKLKYPGDTSLGAAIKEVANCRCSAQYRTEVR